MSEELPEIEIVVDPDLVGDDHEYTLGGNTEFRFIGRGLSLEEFVAYVEGYEFGNAVGVVLHHTSVPDASWGKINKASWDAGEDGLTAEQVYGKRAAQLKSVARYYEQKLGWDRGPHLFIDDTRIWLFSPMSAPGIHAKNGNGNRGGYTVGIEVVGHFAKKKWPKSIETLVGGAVAALQRKLGFDLEHSTTVHNVSSHRDWGKPECPGDAITNDYYLGVLKREARKFKTPVVESVQKPTNGDIVVNATYVCMGNALRIRQAPNTSSPVAGTLKYGQSVAIDVIKPNEELVIDTTAWGHLADGRGFVSMKHMRPV